MAKFARLIDLLTLPPTTNTKVMLSSQLLHHSMIGAISALLCLNHSASRPEKVTTAEISCNCYKGPLVVPPMQQQDLIARGHDACCETALPSRAQRMPLLAIRPSATDGRFFRHGPFA